MYIFWKIKINRIHLTISTLTQFGAMIRLVFGYFIFFFVFFVLVDTIYRNIPIILLPSLQGRATWLNFGELVIIGSNSDGSSKSLFFRS